MDRLFGTTESASRRDTSTPAQTYLVALASESSLSTPSATWSSLVTLYALLLACPAALVRAVAGMRGIFVLAAWRHG